MILTHRILSNWFRGCYNDEVDPEKALSHGSVRENFDRSLVLVQSLVEYVWNIKRTTRVEGEDPPPDTCPVVAWNTGSNEFRGWLECHELGAREYLASLFVSMRNRLLNNEHVY